MTADAAAPSSRGDTPDAPVRRRLIISAVDLIRTHGMAGTTVSGLLAHSGAARRTLYQHFGSREALLATAVREAGAVMTARLRTGWDADVDPLSALDVLVATIGDGIGARGPAAGCPIIAASLGGSDVPDARPIAAAVFADWRRLIADSLRTHGAASDRADRLATTCVAAIEGALALGIAEGSRAPVDDVAAELRELLHAALPATGATPARSAH